MLEGELLDFYNKKVDSIINIVTSFSGGKLDLLAKDAKISIRCKIYKFSKDEVIIPIGTRSLPAGISDTDADIIIFIGDNDDKLSIFTDRLKEVIKKEIKRENLFLDSTVHNCMCIKLNKNKLI